jgi:hypothetical protein
MLHLLIAVIVLLLSHFARAQAPPDTVRPGKGVLVPRQLKPGLRQYLIVMQDPKSKRQLGFWYWLRDIRQEKREGKDVILINQRWYSSDTSTYREVYSVNNAADFAPVYFRENVPGMTVAYNWKEDGIAGADSVEGNKRKGWSLAFTEPNLNWNLDIETFELLPLAAGKSFLINFYDAGLDPPQYVLYSVKGSEQLTLLDGAQVDCWKLVTEGKSPQGTAYSETYWISKKGREFLKEEDHYGDTYRLKIRMPTMTPDIRLPG